MIWYAADEMGLAGVQEVRETEHEIILGGFNWLNDAFVEIEAGNYHATNGGHFVELGFTLIMLKDYFNGHDFKDDLGTKISTPMAVIRKENVGIYRDFIVEQDWAAIDFRSYSKHLNPGLLHYDFSFDALIKNKR